MNNDKKPSPMLCEDCIAPTYAEAQKPCKHNLKYKYIDNTPNAARLMAALRAGKRAS